MLAHGRSPARHKQAEKYAVAHATTLFEFGERYFTEIVQRDCKDPRAIRRYLDKETYPRLADKAVRDITPAEIQAIVFRKRDGGAPSSAAQIRNLLKRMFEYAMANGLITLNPALTIPMRFITQARPRTRTLSPSELRIYLQTLYQSNIRRQFKLALHQILLTLVRKSELIFTRWEHVDFDAAEWQIPAENSKTRAPHILNPICRHLSRTAESGGRLTLGHTQQKQLGQALQHDGIKPSSGGCELRDASIHHS
jgi:integrase